LFPIPKIDRIFYSIGAVSSTLRAHFSLAVALAANGNFAEAIENAHLVIQLAMSEGNTQLAQDIQEHIESYKNNMPYRE